MRRRLPVPGPRPMGYLRWAVYTLGVRPRGGVLYSPSLAIITARQVASKPWMDHLAEIEATHERTSDQ